MRKYAARLQRLLPHTVAILLSELHTYSYTLFVSFLSWELQFPFRAEYFFSFLIPIFIIPGGELYCTFYLVNIC